MPKSLTSSAIFRCTSSFGGGAQPSMQAILYDAVPPRATPRFSQHSRIGKWQYGGEALPSNLRSGPAAQLTRYFFSLKYGK